MVERLEIGRLLRAGTTGFVLGCRVSYLKSPLFGSLVRAPLGADEFGRSLPGLRDYPRCPY